MRTPDEITISGKTLAKILEAHLKWWRDQEGGERANLTGANLTRANLTGADLTRANLTGADLTGADLTRANLTGADLTGANLTGANLTGADLTRANLTGANLTGADLTRANLTGADLTGADLTGADLTGANLTWANLTGADLTGANLTWANLTGANLTGAKNAELAMALTVITPEGEIIGWKQLRDNKIARLIIPAEAKRTNASGRKCRAEFAIVDKIYDGDKEVEYGCSKYDADFGYKVGDTVRPQHPFDEDRWHECTSGIHFYLTRIEAENN